MGFITGDLITAAIPSAFSAISGLFGAGKANKKLNNLKRPEYQIPTSVNKSVNIAQRLANTNMAGYGLQQQNIGLSQANMVEAARQGAGGGLGNVAAIQAGSNQAYQQLGAQNAQYNQQMQQNLQSALGQLASYQDKEWQLNEFAPYKDEYNRLTDQKKTGQESFYKGMGGLSSLFQAKMLSESGNLTEMTWNLPDYSGKFKG